MSWGNPLFKCNFVDKIFIANSFGVLGSIMNVLCHICSPQSQRHIHTHTHTHTHTHVLHFF